MKSLIIIIAIVLIASIAKADTCKYVLNPSGEDMIYVCVDDNGNVYFPFGN